jgi:glycerol-3-phosphate acyltransferase PlsX
VTRSEWSSHTTARIAVDLLGGDGAPAVVVDGALRACAADPDLHLLLVGPREAADEVIGALPAADRDRATVKVVDDVVGMGENPLRAVRGGGTTVRAAVEALYAHRVDAIVSAGNSAGAVTAAAHVLGRFSGIRRPALAAVIPSATGPVILLDVGAAIDATMLELIHNAVLGCAYATVVHDLEAPRVGLLSIGSEPGKGDRLRRAVSIALSEAPLPGNGRYVGLVEGNDVPLGGPADVVVTDGFTGNVLLKGIEGAYQMAAMHEHPAIGAPKAAALLGVSGTVVVCHGAAGAADVAAGVLLAARLHRGGMVARLEEVSGEFVVEVAAATARQLGAAAFERRSRSEA